MTQWLTHKDIYCHLLAVLVSYLEYHLIKTKSDSSPKRKNYVIICHFKPVAYHIHSFMEQKKIKYVGNQKKNKNVGNQADLVINDFHMNEK